MDKSNEIQEIQKGLQTAYIDSDISSNLAYKPQFVFNNHKNGKKVLSEIENELKNCEEFKISVAFITLSGISPLLMTLKELEKRNILGKIITTDYLVFSEPAALKKLAKLKNIELKMYCVDQGKPGLHTKGYIFRSKEIYRIIAGSSNMTMNALTVNKEWNTKVISTKNGEYTKEVLAEFNYMWEQSDDVHDVLTTYEKRYEEKQMILRETKMSSIKQYTLEPNTMQVSFIRNLEKLRNEGADKALLLSATGTGKTYASAFAMREHNPERALFIVHREQIAKKSIESYKHVFGDTKTFGLLSGNVKELDAEYIFATMQMMSKEEVYINFAPDEFQMIVIDEVHRAGSNSYKKIMDYFKPEFWLGMTASPDRPDGFDIYGLFDYNIAYEIRLQKALENNLLCPFQYFGITDIVTNSDVFENESELEKFNLLTAEARVDYIIEQANYYGYSGDRVKGLVFCSTKSEAKILSNKFNERMNGSEKFKTTFLSGDNSQIEREEAIERLVAEKTEEDDSLDYIFTVDIFNEGIDIPEINQVIMLRPTQSPIVFIQQLGRGLRKSVGKEFVVILDFIGNYTNNFMIPIALSGDRTYNKDNIRRYMVEGNRIIAGSSSIHFDEIAQKRIFESIDIAKTNTVKMLREEYIKLKNKVGHIPTYSEFEKYGAIDIMLFFENDRIGSYHEFLKKYEDEYHTHYSQIQEELLRFFSNKIANGKRNTELEYLRRMTAYFGEITNKEDLTVWLKEHENSNVIKVLTNQFVSNENSKKKYQNSVLIGNDENGYDIPEKIKEAFSDEKFRQEVEGLVEFGLNRNKLYYSKTYKHTDFVLYQKYTYEDVCKLLNWERNVVAQNIGGYKYDEKTNTFPVFINYKKDESISDTIKYDDRFVDERTLIALSKQSRTVESKEIVRIYNAHNNGMKIHLFVRKNKDDNMFKEFYFLGEMHAIGQPYGMVMKNTNKKAVEITYQLDVPVREDIYDYIIS